MHKQNIPEAKDFDVGRGPCKNSIRQEILKKEAPRGWLRFLYTLTHTI